MLTRRAALGTITAGVLFGKASQPATPVSFSVPPNSCDCHTHIFGDPKQFPLWPGRSYTPEPALPEEMSALHRALHIKRVVIVTPSVYGTDNSATLYGIKARGADARGIAVIDNHTSDSDLDAMGRAGFCGIRINPATGVSTDPAALARNFRIAVERMQTRNWHIQINTSLAVISVIKDVVRASPVPVVFDHFGGAKAALGLNQPGFSDLLELVHSGKAWVKISCAYRASNRPPDYPDVTPLARALIEANADQILWGTDWPHPDAARLSGRKPDQVSPLLQIDDGRLLNQLPIWTADPAVRKKILVNNPARLYRF